MFRLICMSFDGDYVKESNLFETIEDAWEHSSNLGSKWYFYPFHFVTTESYKTIVESAGVLLFSCNNKRLKTVKKMFSDTAKKSKAAGLDCFEYAELINDIYDRQV